MDWECHVDLKYHFNLFVKALKYIFTTSVWSCWFCFYKNIGIQILSVVFVRELGECLCMTLSFTVMSLRVCFVFFVGQEELEVPFLRPPNGLIEDCIYFPTVFSSFCFPHKQEWNRTKLEASLVRDLLPNVQSAPQNEGNFCSSFSLKWGLFLRNDPLRREMSVFCIIKW